MSQSKTPYEIRSELLILAYDIVRNRMRAVKADELRALMNNENNKSNDIYPSEGEHVTSEMIIEEATKLNNFVSAPPLTRNS